MTPSKELTQEVEEIVNTFARKCGTFGVLTHESNEKWLRTQLTSLAERVEDETTITMNQLLVAFKKGAQEMRKKVEGNVGFLRQWLNEDRITDAKKMVTNEQLFKWLFPNDE